MAAEVEAQRQLPMSDRTTNPAATEDLSRHRQRGDNRSSENSESGNKHSRGSRRRGQKQPAKGPENEASKVLDDIGDATVSTGSRRSRRSRIERKGNANDFTEQDANGLSSHTSQNSSNQVRTLDPSDSGPSSSTSRQRNRNRRANNKNDRLADSDETYSANNTLNVTAQEFVPSGIGIEAFINQPSPHQQPSTRTRRRERGTGSVPKEVVRLQSQALKTNRARNNFGAQLTIPSADDEEHEHETHQHAHRPPPTSSLDLHEYFSGHDLSDNSLAVSMLQDIHSGAYECMICISPVTRKSKIWTCATCYRSFHINCIQKWAKQIKDTAAAAPGADPTIPIAWRCPGCQTARQEIPDRYRCWCGKVENPDQSPLFPPHSCGQICSHEYPNCPHVCNISCHPGPHPKCTAMGPPLDCFCGKSNTQWRCVDTKYDGWSCGVVCGEMMACGVHTCPRPCHTGLCGPCEAPIHSSCYCGKEDKDIKCCQTLPARKSFFIDEDGDEAWWTGIWKCDNKCGRDLDCGVHSCEKTCHVQDLEPAHCPLSPDVITSCPCGKHSVSEILGHERASCEDPIPTCRDQCEKTLLCGHQCKLVCHSGACGPCVEEVIVPCVCGYNQITLPW